MRKKKIFQTVLYALVACIVIFSLVYVILDHYKNTTFQIANPASVFCNENGGSLEIRNTTEGQIGVCKFSDGTVCEEWDYYNGDCSVGYSKYLTLEDYYADVNTYCNTVEDCEIKNVGNCCGQLPKCVNKNYIPDPDFVTEKCEDEDLFSGCGFMAFNKCLCVDNNCIADTL